MYPNFAFHIQKAQRGGPGKGVPGDHQGPDQEGERGARHHLPLREDLQGQVRGERLHRQRDVGSGGGSLGVFSALFCSLIQGKNP